VGCASGWERAGTSENAVNGPLERCLASPVAKAMEDRYEAQHEPGRLPRENNAR
jgi:hypothetical protein